MAKFTKLLNVWSLKLLVQLIININIFTYPFASHYLLRNVQSIERKSKIDDSFNTTLYILEPYDFHANLKMDFNKNFSIEHLNIYEMVVQRDCCSHNLYK